MQLNSNGIAKLYTIKSKPDIKSGPKKVTGQNRKLKSVNKRGNKYKPMTPQYKLQNATCAGSVEPFVDKITALCYEFRSIQSGCLLLQKILKILKQQTSKHSKRKRTLSFKP